MGAKIPDGPLHRGFDHFRGFHHARNMEAVIEDDEVVAHDPPINMLPRLTRESVEYLESRKGKKEPFFLSCHSVLPIRPSCRRRSGKGKAVWVNTGISSCRLKSVVGEIQAALKRIGKADDTLVVFTSDNGCSKAAGIGELAEKGHTVSAHLRGSKADLWDGGHRIPFIVKWPGKVNPGSRSDQLICLTDLFATLSEITGIKLPKGSAEDSVSFLAALSGKPIVSTRNGVIHHSISGHFAYRQGQWKLLLARASGGWTSPKENQAKGALPAQLYDMKAGVGEKKIFTAKNPSGGQTSSPS